MGRNRRAPWRVYHGPVDNYVDGAVIIPRLLPGVSVLLIAHNTCDVIVINEPVRVFLFAYNGARQMSLIPTYVVCVRVCVCVRGVRKRENIFAMVFRSG